VEKPPTYSKRLIHNSLFSISATISTSIIAFFLVPFLVKYLGKEGYGVWVLVGSVFAYAMTLQLGLSSAINRHIPVFLVKQDRLGIDRVVSSSVFFFGCVGLILAVVAIVVSLNLDSWFTIPSNLVGAGKSLVLIVGGLFALSMLVRPFGAVISGFQRYDILGLGLLIPYALRAALVVWALLAGHGLIVVGLIFGLSELATQCVYWFFSRRLLGSLSISARRVDFVLLRQMMAYGTSTFLYVTTTVIVFKGSDIILGVFLTASEVARFALAAAPVLMATELIGASLAAVKPAVRDLDAREDDERVREISFLGQKYSLLVMLPATSFLILMGREFLVLWVGSDFADVGTILAILAIGRFFMAAQHSNFLVLVGKGEHRVFGIMAVTMAASAIALGVIFVGVFDWGITGMAVACAAPMVLIYGLIMPIYYNRRMSLSVVELARRVFGPALLGCASAIALIGIWKLASPPTSWLQLVMVIVSVAVVWVPSVWKISLSAVERERFLGAVTGRRGGQRDKRDTDKAEA
jgi:O-antigen/teichoic acid export membrane protein